MPITSSKGVKSSASSQPSGPGSSSGHSLFFTRRKSPSSSDEDAQRSAPAGEAAADASAAAPPSASGGAVVTRRAGAGAPGKAALATTRRSMLAQEEESEPHSVTTPQQEQDGTPQLPTELVFATSSSSPTQTAHSSSAPQAGSQPLSLSQAPLPPAPPADAPLSRRADGGGPSLAEEPSARTPAAPEQGAPAPSSPSSSSRPGKAVRGRSSASSRNRMSATWDTAVFNGTGMGAGSASTLAGPAGTSLRRAAGGALPTEWSRQPPSSASPLGGVGDLPAVLSWLPASPRASPGARHGTALCWPLPVLRRCPERALAWWLCLPQVRGTAATAAAAATGAPPRRCSRCARPRRRRRPSACPLLARRRTATRAAGCPCRAFCSSGRRCVAPRGAHCLALLRRVTPPTHTHKERVAHHSTAPCVCLAEQEEELASRLRQVELPPLQSVLELTTAFKPPSRSFAATVEVAEATTATATATAAAPAAEVQTAGRHLPDGSGVLADGTT